MTKRKKRTSIRKNMNDRRTIIFMIIVVALLGLMIRLWWISHIDRDDYTIRVLNQQQYSTRMIPFRRGDIIDRNGNLMATSVEVYNLVLDPFIILDKDHNYLDPTIQAVVDCFPDLLDATKLRQEVLANPESRYEVQLKKLTYEQTKAMREAMAENDEIQGVWFETEYERKYPLGIIGSDVIGFTYEGNLAEWGLEGYYNDVLNGMDGREYGYVNRDNQQEKIIRNPVHGSTIRSTIDLHIQGILEKHLEAYIKKYNPDNVAIIVADPNNGEILGMTCNDQYDSNNPRDLSAWYTDKEIEALSDQEVVNIFSKRWRNFCISDSYEPGSTMKPFTVAACYEEQLVNAKSTFDCDGSELIGGWTIYCWDHGGHGILDLAGSLMESCNDALMVMGQRLGNDLTEHYQNLFGFGYQTGIDMPGEAEGIFVKAENMDEATLVTNAFGQNINVNMIQMVAGFSALINGGYYYQPHMVSEITSATGTVEKENAPELVKKVISEDTSEYIRYAMKRTAEDGTGSRAAVEGYLCGGKTGTGEKFGEDGQRVSDQYVISFLGYAGNDENEPEVVCFVVCDYPKGLADPTDNTSACHLWRDVMAEVMPYLGIYTIEENQAE